MENLENTHQTISDEEYLPLDGYIQPGLACVLDLIRREMAEKDLRILQVSTLPMVWQCLSLQGIGTSVILGVKQQYPNGRFVAIEPQTMDSDKVAKYMGDIDTIQDFLLDNHLGNHDPNQTEENIIKELNGRPNLIYAADVFENSSGVEKSVIGGGTGAPLEHAAKILEPGGFVVIDNSMGRRSKVDWEQNDLRRCPHSRTLKLVYIYKDRNYEIVVLQKQADLYICGFPPNADRRLIDSQKALVYKQIMQTLGMGGKPLARTAEYENYDMKKIVFRIINLLLCENRFDEGINLMMEVDHDWQSNYADFPTDRIILQALIHIVMNNIQGGVHEQEMKTIFKRLVKFYVADFSRKDHGKALQKVSELIESFCPNGQVGDELLDHIKDMASHLPTENRSALKPGNIDSDLAYGTVRDEIRRMYREPHHFEFCRKLMAKYFPDHQFTKELQAFVPESFLS